MSRSLELAARRLGRAGWSAVVTVLLVEGREMLAMDEEGTSDPYCKFRCEKRVVTELMKSNLLQTRWREIQDQDCVRDSGPQVAGAVRAVPLRRPGPGPRHYCVGQGPEVQR